MADVFDDINLDEDILDAEVSSIDEEIAGLEADEPEVPEAKPEPSEPDYAAIEAEDRRKADEAKKTADAWGAELERRKAAFEEAKAAWTKAENDFINEHIDAAKKLEIQQQLIDARYSLNEAESTAARARQHAQTVEPDRPAAQRAWIAANPRFNSDPVFQAQAIAHAEKLAADGLDNRSPKFYAEIDRLMRGTPRMSANSRASGAPVVRTGNSSGKQSSETTITDFDRRMMPRFGLNANNKAHIAQWKANKRALSEREQRRRGA